VAARDPNVRAAAVQARDKLAATMTPADLAQAESLARAWTPRQGKGLTQQAQR
jgi:hypothetical protein